MTNDSNTVLVQLYLRGGADALTICAPTDEPKYDSNRDVTRVFVPGTPGVPPERIGTQIAPPQFNGVGALTRTGFMIPPAMTPLLGDYSAGQLAFIHGAGTVIDNRSHFVQQANSEYAENGQTGDGNGWLGRYLAHVPPRYLNSGRSSGLRALALNNTRINSFAGGSEVTPTRNPDTFTLPGGAAVEANLQAIYAASTNAVQAALTNDQSAVADLGSVTWGSSTQYPDTDLGRQLSFAFDAIRDLPDLEIVAIDYDNIDGLRWDTHDRQGCFDLNQPNTDPGAMFQLMENLSKSLHQFLADAATLPARRVVVFVYSEFGRTLHENEGEGTDHGRGGIAMLAGDPVVGGQVFTHTQNWSGIAGPSGTEDQPVTVDLRVLQADVLSKCMGVSPSDLALIIPQADNLYPDPVIGDYGILTP